MTLLAWHRGGAAAGPAVVLCHAWAGDGPGDWQATGWPERLARAGLVALACDLPGHGASAEVIVPGGADPAAWTAEAVRADLDRLGASVVGAAGFAEGGLVAGHLAVDAPELVHRLVLVGCDDRVGRPFGAQIAAALRNRRNAPWEQSAMEAVAAARADHRHNRATLADWVERAGWPAAPQLGALRTPVLIAVGAEDEHRAGAPRLARLFHDGRLLTVPGGGREVLSSALLQHAAAEFLTAA